ncbi:FAD-binding protein [Kribbella sp. NPDC023855]|uniref:FAD-binding oxidoreductase n=1 Tax=Kribbella sp. NPDC023855 TaxID=3154698 RepID=UPI0033FBB2C8
MNDLTGMHWTEDTPGYDEERRGYQRLDPHRPTHIVGATTRDDVQRAVRYAREHRLPLAVKATGHGHVWPLDGGVLITTSRLDRVTIDPERKTAWIEAGATWQQVIDAAAPHGLAPLSGSLPGVTAVPYILGGGLSLMARRYGFAADHVRRIEVVTPDGELRNAEDDPDLFWALRGGGGNFGVVTAMEIDLFPVPTLYGGSLYYDLAATPDALQAWHDWAQTVPDAVTSAVGLIPFPDIEPVPARLRGKYIAQLQVSITPDADGPALVTALRDSLGEPLIDTVKQRPFTETGEIFDEPAHPAAYRSRNLLLSELDKQALTTIPNLAGPTAKAMCIVGIRHLGGALSNKPAIDNAVGNRDAQYLLSVLTTGGNDTSDLHRAILEPWTQYAVGRSLNFSFGPLTQAELRETYDDYNRLARLRTHYDPTNLLQPNHPITGRQ